MSHMDDKQTLIDIIRGKEQIYSQMVYVMGYQRLVKATSKEEALRKFQQDHPDIITDNDHVDCEDHSEVIEMDMEISELYDEAKS